MGIQIVPIRPVGSFIVVGEKEKNQRNILCEFELREDNNPALQSFDALWTFDL